MVGTFLLAISMTACERSQAPRTSADKGAASISAENTTVQSPAQGVASENGQSQSSAPPRPNAGSPVAAATSGSAFKSTDVTGANYGKALELLDSTGKLRTLDDFRGKVVLLFFGFTSCPDVCPTALIRAVDIRNALGADADHLQVLFASVDYERDTPDVVGRYAASFDPSFIGLAGDRVQVARAAHEFKVFYQRVPSKDGKSYTIDHTAASYVIDPAGRLRLYVRTAQTAQDVASDIRRLL